MEFNEKLQQLRKANQLTQEQLAEKLYVSRTAVSKWETGNGYPSIDSLKEISKLFQVSIDDLLSGDELIILAANETKSNRDLMRTLLYGLIDLLTIAFVFLPLYGNEEGDMIRAVSLLTYDETLNILFFYWLILSFLILNGLIELMIQFRKITKWFQITMYSSIALSALGILLFALSRQPYATVLMFAFFMIKVFLLVRAHN